MPINCSDTLSSFGRVDNKNDDDCSSTVTSDLDDDEFARIKERFSALLPKYGTLWRSLVEVHAKKTSQKFLKGTSSSSQFSSPTTASEGGEQRMTAASPSEQNNPATSNICQDGCCQPIFFVSPSLLRQTKEEVEPILINEKIVQSHKSSSNALAEDTASNRMGKNEKNSTYSICNGDIWHADHPFSRDSRANSESGRNNVMADNACDDTKSFSTGDGSSVPYSISFFPTPSSKRNTAEEQNVSPLSMSSVRSFDTKSPCPTGDLQDSNPLPKPDIDKQQSNAKPSEISLFPDVAINRISMYAETQVGNSIENNTSSLEQNLESAYRESVNDEEEGEDYNAGPPFDVKDSDYDDKATTDDENEDEDDSLGGSTAVAFNHVSFDPTPRNGSVPMDTSAYNFEPNKQSVPAFISELTFPSKTKESDTRQDSSAEEKPDEFPSTRDDGESESSFDESNDASSGGSTVVTFNQVSFNPTPKNKDGDGGGQSTSTFKEKRLSALSPPLEGNAGISDSDRHKSVYRNDAGISDDGAKDGPLNNALFDPVTMSENNKQGDGKVLINEIETETSIMNDSVKSKSKSTQHVIDLLDSSSDDEGIFVARKPQPRKATKKLTKTVEVSEISSGESEWIDEKSERPTKYNSIGRMNRTQEKPTLSADTTSSEENEWIDEYSEVSEAEDSVTNIVRRTRKIIIESSDSDGDDDFIAGEDSGSTVESSYQPKTSARIAASGRAFRRIRERLAVETLKEFDRLVFANALFESINVEWSNKLRTTAGRAVLKQKLCQGTGKVRMSTIELSSRIIDNEARLRSTLMHEMCHAAAWIVDNVNKPPHGQCFKKWAKKAMANVRDITITTTHDYEIDFKFMWKCQNSNCGCIYKRHSRSIDITKHACGKCRGRLMEVDATVNGSTAKIRKPPSAYNQFVKQHAASVRQRIEKENRNENGRVTQQDVMKECARLWKDAKQTSAS